MPRDRPRQRGQWEKKKKNQAAKWSIKSATNFFSLSPTTLFFLSPRRISEEFGQLKKKVRSWFRFRFYFSFFELFLSPIFHFRFSDFSFFIYFSDFLFSDFCFLIFVFRFSLSFFLFRFLFFRFLFFIFRFSFYFSFFDLFSFPEFSFSFLFSFSVSVFAEKILNKRSN